MALVGRGWGLDWVIPRLNASWQRPLPSVHVWSLSTLRTCTPLLVTLACHPAQYSMPEFMLAHAGGLEAWLHLFVRVRLSLLWPVPPCALLSHAWPCS